ncbi:uncharacterized protein [Branchiostoma lanceolatum]|uniref:uncharacterized protein n=1 Tax=Branchiostoma lanceolatum TaxID=7740 RepID=UPI0034521A66
MSVDLNSTMADDEVVQLNFGLHGNGRGRGAPGRGRGRGRGRAAAPLPPNPVGGPNPPPAAQHQPVPQDAPQPSGLTAAFARYRTLNPPPTTHGQFDDAPSRTARLRTIPKMLCRFDGTSPIPTWEEFETHFSTDRSYGEWDDALSKTVLLRQLTGDALQTYVTAPDPIKEGPCDLILDFMRKLFSRPNDPSHYEAELFALARRPNELPQALAVRIRRLIAKVHPQADQQTRDSLGLREFVGKITDKQMAWEVQRSKPETFHDAVIALQYYEDLKAQYQTQAQTSHPVNYTAPPPPAHVRQVSDPSPAPALDIQTVLASHRRELRELQQTHEQHVASLQDRFEIALGQARQPVDAHPRPSSKPRSPQTYNPPPRRDTKATECNYCHEDGHWKRECPQLLRAAARRQSGNDGWLA